MADRFPRAGEDIDDWFGIYILYSLVLFIIYGFLILSIIVCGGIGSDPRNGCCGVTAKRPPMTIIGRSNGSSLSLRRSLGYAAAMPPIGIPASFRTLTSGSPLVGSPSGLTNARTTEATTIAPHQIPQSSHDDDAASNWSSAAFIVPFGRHHADKNSFRTFLIALVVWLLVFCVIFLLMWLV